MWPDDTDLAAFLSGMRVDVPSGTDMEAVLDAAVAEFEQLTGFEPFLAGIDTEARNYTLEESSKLDLRGGLVSIDSVVADGVTLILGTDVFALRPRPRGPYTGLRFAGRTYSQPDGVVVTGLWGYAPSVPADARQAVLGRAAQQLAVRIDGSVKREKAGPVEYEYYVDAGGRFGRLEADFFEVARRYARPTL